MMKNIQGQLRRLEKLARERVEQSQEIQYIEVRAPAGPNNEMKPIDVLFLYPMSADRAACERIRAELGL